MRDSEIIRKMENDSKSLKLAIRQLGFIDMRIQAFEFVLRKRWAMILAIFSPEDFIDKVNRKHLEFLQQHDAEVMEMRAEIKKDALKPKLILPVSSLNGKQNG